MHNLTPFYPQKGYQYILYPSAPVPARDFDRIKPERWIPAYARMTKYEYKDKYLMRGNELAEINLMRLLRRPKGFSQ